MQDRLLQIRKHYGLNQTDFGQRIGLTPAAISKLEKGERNLTDRVVSDICREFNVNEAWLRNGIGEMFTYPNNDIVDQLANEFGLDEVGRRALIAYRKLTPANQEAINKYILFVASEYDAEVQAETEIHEKTRAYEAELRSQKEQEETKLSASPTSKDA